MALQLPVLESQSKTHEEADLRLDLCCSAEGVE